MKKQRAQKQSAPAEPVSVEKEIRGIHIKFDELSRDMQEIKKMLAALRGKGIDKPPSAPAASAKKRKQPPKIQTQPQDRAELKIKMLKLFKEKGNLDFIEVMDELGTDDVVAVLDIFGELRENKIIRAVK